MITKRQLGLGFMALGVVAFLATLLFDWIGGGNFSGIGPLQRLALIGAVLAFLLGLTLLPFGDRPA